MMQYVRDLVPSTDPILREEMPRFDFNNPSIDPTELAHTLAQTMILNRGLGISANQLGIRARAFAMTGVQITVCFNPRIVQYGEDELTLEEGCLSYPNLYIKIKRPQVIKVRYTQADGKTVTKQYQDITARVFQHELDHLNGIVHTDRASYIHKKQAFNEKKKLDRKQKKEANAEKV